jgi:uncharacterized protein (DUF58 family)
VSLAREGSASFLNPDFLKKLERLRLVAKRLSSAGLKGEHPTMRKGFSLEFSDYRKYQVGDDLRYVDWNVYRRMDKLYLKLFTAEEEMNVYLLLDASRSMAEGELKKIDYAKSIAAALGYIGLKNLDKVGAAAFSSGVFSPLALGRGRKQVLGLFGFLEHLACQGETNLQSSIHSFSSLFTHPGLVVLLSDLFDPDGWRAALQELYRRKHQLLIIHILGEREAQVESWGDVTLQEVESGRERKISLDNDLALRFAEAFRGYCDEIELFCRDWGIDYIRTTTALPFEEFVLLTLRQMKSVRSML